MITERLPWDGIPGFFSRHAFYEFMLSRLPANGKVVEVGVFYGKGVAYLAQNKPPGGIKIYGVDTFIHSHAPVHDRSVHTDDEFYQFCVGKLIEARVLDDIILIKLSSLEAAKTFDDASLDCVFIDANHDEASVEEDIRAWRPKLKPGGILSGDDYILPWGGVIEAVNRLVPNRSLMGQAWWVVV